MAPLPRRARATAGRGRGPASSRAGAPSESRSAVTRRKARRFVRGSRPRRAGPPDRPAGAGRAAPRARGSPAGRTARTSRSSTRGCPAGRRGASDRRRDASRCRTRRACPGWTATRHSPISPIASNASFTTSYGPTDTPPATTIASAPWSSAERSRDDDVVELVRGDPERDRLGAGGLDERAEPGPFASGIPAGPRSSPAARTSLPVASTATRGRRRTGTAGEHLRRRRARPRPGSSPSPAARISSPSARSLPRRRTCAPGATARVDEDRRGHRAAGVAPALARRCRSRRAASSARRARPRRRPAGMRRAGRDANRAPGLHGALRHATGRHLAGDGEPRRRLLGGARDIGRADGVAVHRRVVPGRQRHGRDDRPRQHAAERRVHRHVFFRQRAGDRGEDRRACLLDACAAGRPRLVTSRCPRPPSSSSRRCCPRSSTASAGGPCFARTKSDAERRVSTPTSRPSSMTGRPSRPCRWICSRASLSASSRARKRQLRGLDHDLLDPRRRPARLRDPADLRHAEDPDDLVALDDGHGRHRRLAVDQLRRERVDRQARGDRDRVGLHGLADGVPADQLVDLHAVAHGVRRQDEEPAGQRDHRPRERRRRRPAPRCPMPITTKPVIRPLREAAR